MKKAIIILFILPSLIYSQDIEKKTSKNRNSFMIDISGDLKLMTLNEEYSITKPDFGAEGLFLMNERISFCFGYSINADGNIYSFDNAVIGLDVANVLHRLLTEEATPALGFFLRVGRNNLYNHTEYTIGGIDVFFGTGMSYSFKTGLGYDYFLTENICLNSKIYYKYIKDTSIGSSINNNTFTLYTQEVKIHQIVLGVGLQIYLRKKSK